ncbi:MAG TPA: TetR/AcrR family transcriptional regulator [Longimicrobiales bacterium]
MARPRKATDDEVLAAVHGLMNRLGPLEWTLADVAREVGVTPSALVQRFGSKRDLQVALMDRWAESAPSLFATLRAQSVTPLATLYAYAGCVAQLGASSVGLAHHLAYLQIDLSDADMHARLRKQSRETRDSIRTLLDEAFAAEELSGAADTAELARAVEVTLTGSLLVWGIHQEGTSAQAVEHDLDVLLRAYRS